MRLPTATYRLQFREGMDFDRAAALVHYLSDLGISHLYASPLFAASTGSTHGYDIIDPTRIDPAIGGREGLERLSAALKDHGMGLILDIVPNHMAFSPETTWLRDVLRHGRGSRYAGHFDIDPEAGRLRLPWLPAPFHRLAAEGAFAVEDDPDGPVLVTGGLRIPLAATPTLDKARDHPSAIPALHEEQPWQATHWRTEMDAISHRRFFNITGLIGVRVEHAPVFDDAHRLLFDLVAAGIVDGVRVDHVDGLVDPAGYLARLKAHLPDTPVWVEKILTGNEELPPDWPVEGTTGYEMARQIGRVLTDAEGLDRITRRYRAFTGRTAPFTDVLDAARRQIMTNDLSAELWSLAQQAARIAAGHPEWREFGPEEIRQAVLAFVAAFPRYRTYATAGDVGEDDRRLIRDTVEAARPGLIAAAALDALGEMLAGEGPECARLRLRMQQVTGAAAAKSLEDTAFYREVRLLSLNEVGGEPDDDALSPAAFAEVMERRAEGMPAGLTLTSSHDTKRSEDARARLAAASHDPDAFLAWIDAVADSAPEAMDPNIVWYVAQSRLALGDGAEDAAERLAAHTEKALREAKEVTFHTAPNAALEDRVADWARALAARPLAELAPLDGIEAAARCLTLAQTALKLTIPGIPDIYQGAETLTLTLTDPDNRRPPDFDPLARAAEEDTLSGLAREKFDLTRTLLRLRRDHPAPFASGELEVAEAADGRLAFVRSAEGIRICVAVALRTGLSVDAAAHLPGARRVWHHAEGPVSVAMTGA